MLPYMEPDEMIEFALVNSYSNNSIDQNKYRKDLSQKYSDHLDIVAAQQNGLSTIYEELHPQYQGFNNFIDDQNTENIEDKLRTCLNQYKLNKFLKD